MAKNMTRRPFPRGGIRTRLPVTIYRRSSDEFSPTEIEGLALWLDASSTDSLYTTDAGPVVAVASPLDIAGCLCWYDAADASSITKDGSNLVSQWNDKSGNARHATASGSLRPTSGGSQNGRTVMQFTGTQAMTITGNFLQSDNVTMFAVAMKNTDHYGGIISSAPSNPEDSPVLTFYLTTIAWLNRRVLVQQATGNGVYRIVSGQSVGTAQQGFFDGVRGTDTVTATPTNTINTITKIGALRTGSSPDLNGNIAEIVCYSGNLTTAQRASVEAYLAAKWSIAGVHAPATASSDPVGYWADRSGNGRHAVQSLAGSRPLVGTQNSRKALTFGSGPASKALVSATPLAAGDFTVLIAVEQTAAVGYAHILSKVSLGSTITRVGSYWETGSATRGRLALVDTVAGAGGLYSNYPGDLGQLLGRSVLAASVTGTTSANVWLNGLAGVQDSSYSAPASSDSIAVGGQISAGLLAADAYFRGNICEAIVYNRALTTTERQRLERYLAARWGITLAPTVSNADAQNWIDRVYANGGSVSAATAGAVNTFCEAIDAASLRSKMLRLNLFCGTGLNACLTPLYRSASFGASPLGNATDTNQGPFAAGAYTEATGLTPVFASGHYLDTGLTPDAMPLSVVQAMHLAFSNGPIPAQSPAAYPHLVGAANNPADRHYLGSFEMLTSGSATLTGQLGKQATTTAAVLVGANPSSSWVLSRTNATSLAIYQNGSLANTNTSSTTGIASYSRSFFVFKTNFNGSAIGDSIAMPGRHYSIGAGLTGPEVSSYNSALSSFFSAIGRTA